MIDVERRELSRRAGDGDLAAAERLVAYLRRGSDDREAVALSMLCGSPPLAGDNRRVEIHATWIWDALPAGSPPDTAPSSGRWVVTNLVATTFPNAYDSMIRAAILGSGLPPETAIPRLGFRQEWEPIRDAAVREAYLMAGAGPLTSIEQALSCSRCDAPAGTRCACP